MTWRLIAAIWMIFTCTGALGGIAFARSLEIHPTIYSDIKLAKGERKKAFVDVVNPNTAKQTITLSVQAFRQTDDNGALAFYDSEQVRDGITLDVNEVELGPREAIRVYFLIDGTKLPSGDVFAAIFARTTPRAEAAAQSVQVGSLLAIVNGTPPSHVANVSRLAATPLQIGNSINARYDLTNPANEKTATGFFPQITVRAWPYDTRSLQGPLLFAGRTRSIQYRQPGNYFGFIDLQVSAGGKKASRLLFAVTGYWRWLAPLLVGCIVCGVWVFKKRGVWPLSRYSR